MIANHKKSENYIPTTQKRDSVCIKFGKVHYRIQYDQIAYLYKVEGIFFLVDTQKLKLPIFMDKLKDFPLKFQDDLFFKISEDIIVNRTSVRIAEGLDRSIVIASNIIYSNKFKISKQVETAFRFWLLQDTQ